VNVILLKSTINISCGKLNSTYKGTVVCSAAADGPLWWLICQKVNDQKHEESLSLFGSSCPNLLQDWLHILIAACIGWSGMT
jgi:hypothetical protein